MCQAAAQIKLVASKMMVPTMVVVILLSAMHSAVCINFHIVLLAQNSQCPGELVGEPCLTLEQYVSYPSPSQYVTLQFEAGNHTLKSTFSVSSRSYFGLIASGNATIDCNGRSTANVSFSSVNQVDIRGITFIRCGRVELSSTTTGSIVRSNFMQTVGSYYALYITSSQQVSIESCTFVNNTGRAIYLSSRTATIMNCIFRDNLLRFGHGCAIFSTSTSLTIIQSSFRNNTAWYSGSAVYYSASSSYKLTIKQCIFESNNVISGVGGAVYVSGNYGSANEPSSGNIYKSNRASSDGGALYVTQNMYMNGSHFVNNSANTGGAVYASGSSTSIESSKTSFVNNTARSNGGAMFANGNNGAVVTNGTTFINNRAIYGVGGAIHITGNRVSLITYDTTFTNNIGYTGGGALYISDMRSQSSLVLTVNRSTFINNLVTGSNANGGAVNVNNANAQSIAFSDSIFVNNSATNGTGGAIYTREGFSIIDTIFGLNKAPLCAVLNVEQPNFDNPMNVSTSTFLHNSASGSTVRGNTGGVGCIRNADVSIVSSTFSHNTAAGSGGVFAFEKSIINIDSSTFRNNTAIDGGVFYTGVFPSTYTLTQNAFINNRAGDDGGVIYVGRNGSFIEIDGSSFSHNRANDRGGVAAIFGSSVSVTNTNMQNNMAGLGDDISVCNSDSTNRVPSLNERIDPVYPVCVLYDGSVQGNPEPMTHDNSNFDLTAYFRSFIPSSDEEMTTTEEIMTTVEVDPLLKEIQTRLFGTSVIIYLLFSFATIFIAILVVRMVMKRYKKHRKQKAQPQSSKQLPLAERGTSNNNYIDDTEVYDEPDYALQKSNTIPLQQNAGYSQQPHYE